MSGPSVPFRWSWPSQRHVNSEPRWLKPATNATLFQIGWLVAVQGNDQWAAVAALSVLVAHWLFFSRCRREWALILAVVVVGFGVDSILVSRGFFALADGSSLAPVWLMCLWAMFATTLCHAFAWLRHRLAVAALLGAVAPPISYWAGEKIAPLEFPDPLLGLAAVAVVWVVLLPLFSLGVRHVYR